MPPASGPCRAYIGLGSNLSDPVDQLQRALIELDRMPDTHLVRRSSLYRSAPIGKVDQPDFLNAVALVETQLSARALLGALLAIENAHGRARTELNGPRTLDLDLLLFGEKVIREPGLEVPHPRMHERAFVLWPLAEVEPQAQVPGRGKIAQLLAAVADQRVNRIDAGR